MKRLPLAFLLAIPLSAAEQAAEKDMTPWLWANFILLMIALGWLVKKYLGPFFVVRSESIRQGIAEAEAQKAEADRRVADVDARFAALDAEIARLKSEMRSEQAREIERLRARNAAELVRVRLQAEQEIESTVKAARLELRRYAGKLALDLAEQKIRSRMTPEAHRGMTQAFVRSLS